MNLKPANVKRMREKDRITCGCTKHENLRLAISGFNLASTRVHEGNLCPPEAECVMRGKLPTTCHELIDKLLCPRLEGQHHHAPECIAGTCETCAGGLSIPLCEKERQTTGAFMEVHTVLHALP